MNPKTLKTTALVLVVIALVAAAATISYYLQQRRIVALQAELIELAKRQDAPAETESVAPANPPVDAPASPIADSDDPESEAEPDGSPTDATSDAATTRFAFVAKASTKGSTVELSLDYADFLTGDAAAKAAAADGEESPPPNDYYISNKNTKLRTFAVKKGAKFIVMGADPDDTSELSAAQFASAISSNLDGAADAGYWFVIKDEMIRSGKEQWTP